MTDSAQTESASPMASPSPPADDATANDRVRAGRLAILSVLAYLAFDITLPLVKVPLRGMHPGWVLGLVIGPTALFMLLQIWLSRTLVRLRLSAGHLGVALVLSAALWLAFLLVVHPVSGMPLVGQALATARRAAVGLFLTVSLTLLGVLLGRLLTHFINEPNVLLPIALVAMPIDFVGAMMPVGFTHDVVKHAPRLVQSVSVPVPTVGSLHPIGFVGPGDVLFIAIFLTAVQNMRLSERGTFWGMYILLTGAMLIVLITGLPIGALVPMGLAVIIANCRFFHFKRSEIFAMIYAGLFVLALVAAFYATTHHYLFGGK